MNSKLTLPGLYTDEKTRMEYHMDPCDTPSLSRSVAKTLYDRTPRHAWTDHPALNPNYTADNDSKYDFGTAAHALLLLGDASVAVIDADSYRTKDAQFQRDTARDQGKTPLLVEQYAECVAAVSAVREQMEYFGFGDAFKHGNGKPEVVAIANDPVAGVMRCMTDWLVKDMRVFDFKFTSIALNVENVGRHCAQMGYEFQHAFYERVLANIHPELKDNMSMTYFFVENKAPYALLPITLPPDALAKGRDQVDQACKLWAQCRAADIWPLFQGDGAFRVEYPAWSVAEYIK